MTDDILPFADEENDFSPRHFVEKSAHFLPKPVELLSYAPSRAAVTRPLQMLAKEPMVLCICIYNSFAYGCLYLMFSAVPIIFEEGRGWTPVQTSTTFLAVLVGTLIAASFNYLYGRFYFACAMLGSRYHPLPQLTPERSQCVHGQARRPFDARDAPRADDGRRRHLPARLLPPGLGVGRGQDHRARLHRHELLAHLPGAQPPCRRSSYRSLELKVLLQAGINYLLDMMTINAASGPSSAPSRSKALPLVSPMSDICSRTQPSRPTLSSAPSSLPPCPS